MFAQLDARRAGLHARYAEPHRAYHGQAHIDAMLRGLDALGDAVTNRAAVELAIWYHDAVYDPAASDNEARSADLLRAEMVGLADPGLLDQAELMVRLTAGHALPRDVPPAWHGDCALFLDLDLAVLGAPPPEYDAYERGIATEYIRVHGEDRFRAGRTAFLQALLHRPSLFHTSRFNAALDRAARANVQQAIAALALLPPLR